MLGFTLVMTNLTLNNAKHSLHIHCADKLSEMSTVDGLIFVIFLQSMKIGTHENKAIHSIWS